MLTAIISIMLGSVFLLIALAVLSAFWESGRSMDAFDGEDKR